MPEPSNSKLTTKKKSDLVEEVRKLVGKTESFVDFQLQELRFLAFGKALTVYVKGVKDPVIFVSSSGEIAHVDERVIPFLKGLS